MTAALVAAVPIRADEAQFTPSVRENSILFDAQTIVTTGFSGNYMRQPDLADGAPAPNPDDILYIDPDGTVASLLRIDAFRRGPDARELRRLPYDRILARDTGQVFGVAIDRAEHPNLYLAASSAYGLYLTGPDRNGDGLPDRMRRGGPEAGWMAGLFGPGDKAGPGSIWRVDGTTGQIDLFANITLNSKPNSGPALGNITYDPTHRQLFVSDLDTGMIHRLNMDGADQEHFDHGVTGRVAAALAPRPFDPKNRLDPTAPEFHTLNPASWAFAHDQRRVWGVATHRGRLFYTVASGTSPRPEVWSVGLHKETGAFLDDPRWELTLPEGLAPLELSDMAFTTGGVMLLSQRGARMASYDFSTLAAPAQASILRFVPEDPDDPQAARTPSDWIYTPGAYATGFATGGKAAAGGLALGPGYDSKGNLDDTACHGTLWSTGEALRDNAGYAQSLRPSGMLQVDGVQAQPVGLLFQDNTPPWVSYFHDFDGLYPTDPRFGHMGDTEVLGCRGTGAAAPEVYLSGLSPVTPANTAPGSTGTPPGSGLCTSPSCLAVLCLVNPSLCQPQQDNACATATAQVTCDPVTGTYVLDMALGLPATPALDRIKLSDASGTLTALPQEQPTGGQTPIDLSGLAPGQVGSVQICAFDSTLQATGAPYPCCNTSVSFIMPGDACEQEGEQ